MSWRRARRHGWMTLAVVMVAASCSDGLDPDAPADPVDDERLPPATDSRVDESFPTLPAEP